VYYQAPKRGFVTRIHGRGNYLRRSLSRGRLQCSGLAHMSRQLHLLVRRYGRSWSHPLLSDGSTSSFACHPHRPLHPSELPRCVPSGPSSCSSGTARSQSRHRNWRDNAIGHYCAGSLSRKTSRRCSLYDLRMNRGYNSLHLRDSKAEFFRHWHHHRIL
jgi:hypothetical protein